MRNVHHTTIHYWKRTSPDSADALRDAQEERAMSVRFARQSLAETAVQAGKDLLTGPRTTTSPKSSTTAATPKRN